MINETDNISSFDDIEQRRTINGHRYQVRRLPFYKGMAVMTLLKEVVGDSIFGVLRNGLDAMTAEVAGTMINLIGSMGDPKMIEAVNTMSTEAELLRDGDAGWVRMIETDIMGRPTQNNLDVIFQKYPEDIIPYLSFILEVNFRGFFTGGSSELNSLMNRLPPEVQEFLGVLKKEGSRFLTGLIGLSGGSSESDMGELLLSKSESDGGSQT